jgi:hypothetical protein
MCAFSKTLIQQVMAAYCSAACPFQLFEKALPPAAKFEERVQMVMQRAPAGGAAAAAKEADALYLHARRYLPLPPPVGRM